MEEDHMRKVFIEDNCKMLTKVGVDDAFLQYSTADSAFQHFPFLGVWNIPQWKPYACVTQFLFCVMVLQLSSMKTLRMWSSSMQHVGPFIDANRRALFWRCKRVASERECIWYPYTRGPKNLPKKVPKKAFRATLESKKYIVGPKNQNVCKLQK